MVGRGTVRKIQEQTKQGARKKKKTHRKQVGHGRALKYKEREGEKKRRGAWVSYRDTEIGRCECGKGEKKKKNSKSRKSWVTGDRVRAKLVIRGKLIPERKTVNWI